MEISDQLHSVFSARLNERAGTYTIEVPRQEVDLGSLVEGQTYRIALLPTPNSEPPQQADTLQRPEPNQDAPHQYDDRSPPVDVGDERTVEIVGIGDQGDGITRIENGFVVIVPDTERGERVRIEITDVQETVAFGDVVERLSYYA